MPDTPLALEVRSVTKAFGPIVALNDVSFTLRRGEIHALVGHNGAGKSTLVKTLAGVVSPDQGEILIDGTPVTLTNARQAQAAGIAVVEQELSLVPALTVLENILLGRVGANFRSRADDRRQVQGLLTRLGPQRCAGPTPWWRISPWPSASWWRSRARSAATRAS